MPPKSYKVARDWEVRVSGMEKVQAYFADLGRAAQAVGAVRARVVTDSPYAHWIEEGFYLHGRPGRRAAGPARMMQAGLERVRELLKPAIVRNLERGPQGVDHAISGVLGEGTKTIRDRTPVQSGDLRASFHTIRADR